MADGLLDIADLEIRFGSQPPIVNNVQLTVRAGQISAIVGESGSGKTMLARSILGLLPPGGRIVSGQINFNGRDLTQLRLSDLQSVRGAEIGMIFQEPMVSLNPVLRIGFQMCEAIVKHKGIEPSVARARAIELLGAMRVPEPEQTMDKFPHEFSGGMRQRIMIASNLMMEPKLLIADEPTTALDCLVQKDILELLVGLARAENMAILLISHDLSLVAQYADQVLVMENGVGVEQGSVSKILKQPQHPYTKGLLASLPGRKPGDRPAPPEERKLVDLQKVNANYPIRKTWIWQRQTYKPVLHDVSLSVFEGETLAIVGESGSGKTTLGRAILRLTPIVSGSIEVDGKSISGRSPPGFREMSRIAQLVYQDPYSSLSPRQKVRDIVAEPLRVGGGSAPPEQVQTMLTDVGLNQEFGERYPNELSGGQRQRVAIARALITNPRLVIADEPVSALDITVQAQILDLLSDLKEKRAFTCIFISHDLGVVEQIADRVAVLYQGRLVELGSADEVFKAPQHPYTKELLDALPTLQSSDDGSYVLKRRSMAAARHDGLSKNQSDVGPSEL